MKKLLVFLNIANLFTINLSTLIACKNTTHNKTGQKSIIIPLEQNKNISKLKEKEKEIQDLSEKFSTKSEDLNKTKTDLKSKQNELDQTKADLETKQNELDQTKKI